MSVSSFVYILWGIRDNESTFMVSRDGPIKYAYFSHFWRFVRGNPRNLTELESIQQLSGYNWGNFQW